jgi:hypothetical protein
MLIDYLNNCVKQEIKITDLTNRKISEIRKIFREMKNDHYGQQSRGCYFWDSLPNKIMEVIYPPLRNPEGFSEPQEGYMFADEYTGSTEYTHQLMDDGKYHALGYHAYAYLHGPADYGVVTTLLDKRSRYHHVKVTEELLSLLKHL